MVKKDRKREIAEKLVEAEKEEEKKQQTSKLKAKLLKIKLAAVGINLDDPEQRRDKIEASKNSGTFKEMKQNSTKAQDQRRLEGERDNINKGTKIHPTKKNSNMSTLLRKKLAKIRQAGRFDKEKPNIYGDSPEQARARELITAVQKNRKLQKPMNSPEGRKANHDFVFNNKKINPSSALKKERMQGAKTKLQKIRQANIEHSHGHTFVFKGHSKGIYRSASLESQQGHYAKYWLLNAKQTNGNGWGIAAHSAKANMHKFIGRPLVITSAKWRGSKILDKYGDTFDHPYIQTNDLNKIFAHQEQYRVGNIVDIGEKDGDYYAMVEMLPKFANMSLPPFCSPAIYQLDAKEAEGQISKWEALHLAALDVDPAYGARIALLKGTCVGTNNECRIQFKSAKKIGKDMPVDSDTPEQARARELITFVQNNRKMQKHVNSPEGRKANKAWVNDGVRINPSEALKKERMQGARLKRKLARITKGNTTFDSQQPEDITDIDDIVRNLKPIPGTAGTKRRSKRRRRAGQKFIQQTTAKFVGRPGESKKNIIKRKAGELMSGAAIMKDGEEKDEFNRVLDSKITCPIQLKKKVAILKKKQRLANENLTYMESKKVKIHKRLHPEVRKARTNIEDVLRKSGSSVDGSHAQSTFLGSRGDFIGGGKKGADLDATHTKQIEKILGTKISVGDSEQSINDFSTKHNLPRVQTFPISRSGTKMTSFGINSKLNSSQLRSITDLERGGRTVGFAVGQENNITAGEGTKDLMNALRKHKLL